MTDIYHLTHVDNLPTILAEGGLHCDTAVYGTPIGAIGIAHRDLNWKFPSKMEFIDAGLTALVDETQRRDITSIAIPALGCGNGGLNWAEVRPRIEHIFAPLSSIEVLLFDPPTVQIESTAAAD